MRENEEQFPSSNFSRRIENKNFRWPSFEKKRIKFFRAKEKKRRYFSQWEFSDQKRRKTFFFGQFSEIRRQIIFFEGNFSRKIQNKILFGTIFLKKTGINFFWAIYRNKKE